ncbi:MAG: DUF4105 domain-containing protein [Elusimicrobia bacterium]|nr:DUF4105 domain-containing protein [Elusimicrobiota bacterium]
MRGRRTRVLSIFFVAAMALGLVLLQSGPKAPWAPEFATPVGVRLKDGSVSLENLRDFVWTRRGLHEQFIDITVDPRTLESLWLLVSPLSAKNRGPAHLMLSFGFADGTFLTVSAEARRRTGEPYSVWRGLQRRYRLGYIVSTERDAITLRTEGRGAAVYLYPVRATPVSIQRLFQMMLIRAESLEARPEFYNTLWNNCAQNIRRHVNTLGGAPFRRSWRFILPGFLDQEAVSRGLLNLPGPLAEVREQFRIHPETVDPLDPLFSQKIRQGLGARP